MASLLSKATKVAKAAVETGGIAPLTKQKLDQQKKQEKKQEKSSDSEGFADAYRAWYMDQKNQNEPNPKDFKVPSEQAQTIVKNIEKKVKNTNEAENEKWLANYAATTESEFFNKDSQVVKQVTDNVKAGTTSSQLGAQQAGAEQAVTNADIEERYKPIPTVERNIQQVSTPGIGQSQNTNVQKNAFNASYSGANIGEIQDASAAQRQAAVQAQIAKAGTVAQADVNQTLAATLDTEQQAQFRAAQQNLLEQLQSGQPTAAQIGLEQATDRNVAQQIAVAQQRGGDTVLAQREAARNIANINQQAVGEGSLLNAQELAQRQALLAQLTQQGRGQDIEIAGTQAGLQQQANIANLGAQQETGLANVGALNQANLANLSVEAQTRLANQAATNQQYTQQADLTQQAELANKAIQAQRVITQAQYQQQAGLAGQDINAQVAAQNAAAQNAAYTQSAGAQNEAQIRQAELALQAQQTNQQGQIQGRSLDDIQAAQALQAQIERQAQIDAQTMQKTGITAQQGSQQAAQWAANAQAQKDRDLQKQMAVLQGVTSIGAAAASARTKPDGIPIEEEEDPTKKPGYKADYNQSASRNFV